MIKYVYYTSKRTERERPCTVETLVKVGVTTDTRGLERRGGDLFITDFFGSPEEPSSTGQFCSSTVALEYFATKRDKEHESGSDHGIVGSLDWEQSS